MTSETFSSSRCILRRYEEKDRDSFCRIFTDNDVMQFMGGGVFESRDAASGLFDKILALYQNPGKHFEIWAIIIEEKLAGHFELKETCNTSDEELEIVYLLDKRFWGQRFMPEAINAVLDYSTSYGKKIIATINPDNANTLKALEKTGPIEAGWVELDGEKVFKITLSSR